MKKINASVKEIKYFHSDALLTQVDLLNTLNDTGCRYIAKVKGNQEKSRDKAKDTIKLFSEETVKIKDPR